METSSKTFSVEQSYVISMLFFLHLWPLVEPKITEEERLLGSYCLFFIVACSGDNCSVGWSEAIRRTLRIPKEKQKTLQLSLSDTFSCALEFCRLHNELYDSKITYAVHLLESMKEKPEYHKNEWAVWQDVVEQMVNKYMDGNSFDWSAELLSWSE